MGKLFITFFGLVLVCIYPEMLLFGFIHTFWPIIPALGFWHVAAVDLLVSLLFRYRRNQTSSN